MYESQPFKFGMWIFYVFNFFMCILNAQSFGKDFLFIKLTGEREFENLFKSGE